MLCKMFFSEAKFYLSNLKPGSYNIMFPIAKIDFLRPNCSKISPGPPPYLTRLASYAAPNLFASLATSQS